MSNPLATPGETVHFLESMTVAVPHGHDSTRGEVVRRGQQICLTAGMIEASQDRNGASPFDLLGDDAGQIARWGRVMFRHGEFPENEHPWIYGDPEWAKARAAAHKAAHAETGPDRRRAALDHVQEVYGAAPSTQTTLQDIKGDNERAALLTEYLNS